MFKKFKLTFAAGLVFASLFGGMVGMVAVPSGQAAANCDNSILGIPPWYKGITEGSGSNCRIKGPPNTEDGLERYIWTIVLNIVEIVLRVVAYAAVIFIIYGGFLFMTSNGNSEATSRAIKTIINASVGMVIAINAVVIKNFVWGYVIASGSNDFGIPERSATDILVAGLNAAYFVAAAVAVIMVVIGGLNYVISSGDSAKVTKAKNTILYAIVGIAVVIFAFAITTFINSRF